MYMSCLISIFAVMHSELNFDCFNNILNELVDKHCKNMFYLKCM